MNLDKEDCMSLVSSVFIVVVFSGGFTYLRHRFDKKCKILEETIEQDDHGVSQNIKYLDMKLTSALEKINKIECRLNDQNHVHVNRPNLVSLKLPESAPKCEKVQKSQQNSRKKNVERTSDSA